MASSTNNITSSSQIDSITPTVTSYVYDNVEVIKTGRTAVRTVRQGVTDQLVEIKPYNIDGPQWKKWVKETDLYKIIRTIPGAEA